MMPSSSSRASTASNPRYKPTLPVSTRKKWPQSASSSSSRKVLESTCSPDQRTSPAGTSRAQAARKTTFWTSYVSCSIRPCRLNKSSKSWMCSSLRRAEGTCRKSWRPRSAVKQSRTTKWCPVDSSLSKAGQGDDFGDLVGDLVGDFVGVAVGHFSSTLACHSSTRSFETHKTLVPSCAATAVSKRGCAVADRVCSEPKESPGPTTAQHVEALSPRDPAATNPSLSGGGPSKVGLRREAVRGAGWRGACTAGWCLGASRPLFIRRPLRLLRGPRPLALRREAGGFALPFLVLESSSDAILAPLRNSATAPFTTI
mmetsp:Transcript_23388/g.79001  ORF Transcript_23388/g.79001 Transcript_23388/m.79001 type:complete len:314 (+) Transcript_23388:2213-3154(+)